MTDDYGYYVTGRYEFNSCDIDFMRSVNSPLLTPRKPIVFDSAFLTALPSINVEGIEHSPIGFVGMLESDTNIFESRTSETGVNASIIAGRYNLVLAYGRSA